LTRTDKWNKIPGRVSFDFDNANNDGRLKLMSENPSHDLISAISRELESIKADILDIRCEISKMAVRDRPMEVCASLHYLMDAALAKADVRLDMLEKNVKVVAEVQGSHLSQTTRLIRELESDLSVRIDDSHAAIRQMVAL
jgi:hypothetical protein